MQYILTTPYICNIFSSIDNIKPTSHSYKNYMIL